LKLLFAMDSFPRYGTSESLEISKRLMARGHEVLVCTSDRTIDGERRSASSVEGVPVRYLRSAYFPQVPYVLAPTALFSIASAIRSFKPDVSVCMHLVHFTTNAAVLASAMSSVPAFLGIRGPRLSFGSTIPDAAKKVFEKTAARVTIGLSTKVIFDCQASMRSVTIDPQSKGAVVYSGVDTHRYVPKPKKGGKTVTFVGGLLATKGVEYLVRAVPKVLKAHPDAVFQVVGEGAPRARLEGLAARLGVSQKVVFLGYRTDVPDILAGTDVFVLPSLSEGVSLSLLQAGSSGLACVATGVGGNLEVIDDARNGFLVEPRSGDALADRISQLLGDPDLRARFGSELRRKVVAKFDWEPICDSLESMVKEAAGTG
jgi:glycosyltransferase involved in cell wall biosynthesis